MLGSNIFNAIILTLCAGLATGVGGIIIIFAKKFNPRLLSLAMGFSAGVMIFISLAELFPEARQSLALIYGAKKGLIYTLLAFFGGMGIIAIIDNFVPKEENPHEITDLTLEGIEKKEHGKSLPIDNTHNKHSHKKLLRVGILSCIVIGVHNFPEGIATFVSAMESPALGLSIAFAIALHNIPEGIAIAIPIYYSTKNKWKAITYATLSGLAEPIGGIVGYYLLEGILNDSLLGIILAMVAGIMVYISLDELLPTAENYGEHHTAIAGVIAGMVFIGFGLALF